MNNGNNMPLHAPLIPSPFVPYECADHRVLFALCRGNEEQIRKFLASTPFEYVDNQLLISISDFSNCNKVPFMDCAIVVPVKYKHQYGGYYLFEYEDNDAAIAAGRELWGYPKKYAHIQLEEKNGVIKGVAHRSNQSIIEIECDLTQPIPALEQPTVTPHLNLRAIPRPDGPGIDRLEVIARDTSPDFQKHSEQYGQATTRIQGLSTDPIDQLEPLEVIGGGMIAGHFYATEQNGWGQVIDQIQE